MAVNREYWLKRWIENRIGFHKTGVNPLLERFWPKVAAAPGRTLAPLCGKSADLMWLASRGHDVVGVELSESAARAFMSEQGLAATIADDPPFTMMRAGRITLLAGDFFDLTPNRIGRFDLIYDRAAIIALPADLRPAYARQLRSLLEPGGRMLLITLEYDQTQTDGPPFSVPESEVRALFVDLAIDRLHEHDCLDEEPRFKERGLKWMKEVVYHVH